MGLYKYREINFLDALVGFVTHPIDTTDELLRKDFPPYMGGCVLCFAATLFTPILAQNYKYEFLQTQMDYISGLALVFFLTGILFVVFETLLLRILGYDCPTSKIAAVFCYCLGPLVPLLLVYYALNIHFVGRLTIATFILTGNRDAGDPLMRFLPWFISVAKLSVLITFSSGLRNLGSQSTVMALLVTALSAFPFYSALILATFIAQTQFPGSVRAVTEVLVWFSQLV